MAQIVFFLGADGAVGQKDERPLARESADRVVGVDPRIHAFARRELGARRTELRRKNRRAAAQGGQEIGGHAGAWWVESVRRRSLLISLPDLPGPSGYEGLR